MFVIALMFQPTVVARLGMASPFCGTGDKLFVCMFVVALTFLSKVVDRLGRAFHFVGLLF